jgi:hypothetical protein
MEISDYIESRGHGAVASLVRESGLSRNTIEKAQRGETIGPKAAKALSAATGGKVSARSLVGV